VQSAAQRYEITARKADLYIGTALNFTMIDVPGAEVACEYLGVEEVKKIVSRRWKQNTTTRILLCA
jgi:hypothetical protein